MPLTPIINISPDRERYRKIPIWRDAFRSLRDIGISQIGIHEMEAGYHVSRATHRYHYHLLPIDCSISYRVLDGDNERSGSIEALSCWQCPQQLPYTFRAPRSGRAIWWSLEKNAVSRPLKKERLLQNTEIQSRIIQLVLWIWKDLSHQTTQEQQRISNSARTLSSYLKEISIDSLHFHQTQKQDLLQPLWEAVYQQAHLAWTLEDLAERCQISRYQLTRLMKKTHNCTPIAMLTKIRLQHAEEYIIENTHTLNEIAEAVGFSTGFALSKAFKKRYGLSPKEFRKQS